jgi:putative membrane protein
MKHSFAILALLLPLMLTACGAPSTSEFVQKAAMSDMYEVAAGKIAATKGQSAAVKLFGQHMTEAHSQTTAELTEILASEKIDVQLPSKLDATHQGLIDDLNGAKETDFDKTYASQQIDAHKQSISLFQKYGERGDNAALKAFAAKTLPVIKTHLEDAKKLAQ